MLCCMQIVESEFQKGLKGFIETSQLLEKEVIVEMTEETTEISSPMSSIDHVCTVELSEKNESGLPIIN